MTEALYLIVGVLAGTCSGLMGIGGGTIAVPALVYIFGMTQHKAQGTVLAAFLPPVVLFSFLKYYSAGNVDIKGAIFVALGLLVGGYFGATISHSLSDVMLKRIFGIFLLIVSTQLILAK